MWYYKNKKFEKEDIPENVIGFVYCITNTITNKKYIGKKIFFNTVKRPPLKGKKRRRISKVDSDWLTYYGSNELLKEETSNQDSLKDYKREILYLCENKAEMSYLEAREQFLRNVLLSDDYYNGWISCRVTQRGLSNVDKKFS
jgi:hypothetical protein